MKNSHSKSRLYHFRLFMSADDRNCMIIIALNGALVGLPKTPLSIKESVFLTDHCRLGTLCTIKYTIISADQTS